MLLSNCIYCSKNYYNDVAIYSCNLFMLLTTKDRIVINRFGVRNSEAPGLIYLFNVITET